MTTKQVTVVTYGEGGYDESKPDNNVISRETVTVFVPDRSPRPKD